MHTFAVLQLSGYKMARVLTLLLVLCTITNVTLALKCYTCSVGENDLDQRCVTDPASVEIGSPITNCNKRYCTSVRQEYIEPKGKVASLTRGCDDKPLYINEIVEDGTHRMFFRACQDDLCNDGDGHDTVGGSGILDQDDGDVIYTKGIGNNSNGVKINLFWLLSTIIIILYNM